VSPTSTDLLDLLEEPSHIFMAIKDFNQQENKIDLLAFIIEQGANYSEHIDMIRNMAIEKNISVESEVIIVNITRKDLTKSEIEKMAQDIVDSIYDGEEDDYDPVSLTLGDIIN